MSEQGDLSSETATTPPPPPTTTTSDAEITNEETGLNSEDAAQEDSCEQEIHLSTLLTQVKKIRIL